MKHTLLVCCLLGCSTVTVEPAMGTQTAAAPVKTTALSDKDIEELFVGLPQIPVEEKPQAFQLRDGPLPPPRTGNTQTVSFPPADAEPQAIEKSTAPLRVLRYAPEGKVAVAEALSITFSQPMVALKSQQEASVFVPVRLSPVPDGQWQWLGTQTLVFIPKKGRFPNSTRYDVEIAEGTRSANGNALKKTHRFEFMTPTLEVTEVVPEQGEPLATTPEFRFTFNQDIQPETLLPFIRFEVEGKPFPIRLIESQETSTARVLSFVPIAPLPTDADVRMTLKKGALSAEGPIPLAQAIGFQFRTHAPIKLLKTECGGRGNCRAEIPWTLFFNNPLDEKAFDEALVSVTPNVEGLNVGVSGNGLFLGGRTQPNTRYQVRIKKGLRDIFGQALTADIETTFQVMEAEPRFFAPQGLVVLSPKKAKPVFKVVSSQYQALKVKLWKVEPKDYAEFEAQSWKEDAQMPGKEVFSGTLPVSDAKSGETQTAISLDAALTNGKGHVIVRVEPSPWKGPYSAPRSTAWVQVTDLAVDAFSDAENLTAYVSSLSDGPPIANVDLSLFPTDIRATSDQGGLAVMSLPKVEAATLLLATLGDDTAFLRGGAWQQQKTEETLVWYVTDDRHVYRPGEEVRIKGLIRASPRFPGSELMAAKVTQLDYVAMDSQGNEMSKGLISLSKLGGFHLQFSVPPTAHLGEAQVLFTSRGPLGGQYHHRISVEEFRRPEFEVKTTVSEGPHFVADSATATVKATYFAGGGLPNAEASWNVTSRQTTFTPPNWDDYIFGKWMPFWRLDGFGPFEDVKSHGNFKGNTNGLGEHSISLKFEATESALPRLFTATASVTDVNRQQWTASSEFIVHPGGSYVGLKPKKYVFREKEDIVVEVVTVDLDGKPVSNSQVSVEAAWVQWKQQQGQWVEIFTQQQACVGKATCHFKSTANGQYRLRATLRDDKNRLNETELRVWVSGHSMISSEAKSEGVQLIPDKKEYAPGETARLLVQAPFSPAFGHLSLRQQGLLKTMALKRFEGSTTVEIPITEAYLPNVHVAVELTGANAQASGAISLSVSKARRTLSVVVQPIKTTVAPGEKAVVQVSVTDSEMKRVPSSEVALWVVDESVLALSNVKTPNPLEVFYAMKDAGVDSQHFRSLPELERKFVRALAMFEGVGAAPRRPTPSLRQNFNPLAAFAPLLSTEANGEVTYSFTMPDNLTRYRVVAVAAASETRFGMGESTLTARLPLMVRPSAPRFLNSGDIFEMPVVLQNQTDKPMLVKVAVRAQNLTLRGNAGVQVTVPANDRTEILFPMAAAQPGKALLQVVARADDGVSDAALISFPVWSPATTEAFASYGTLDEGIAVQDVSVPKNIQQTFGGLSVETSSTQLQSLTDAFLYLVSYPFECSEQVSSRILSIAALKDILSEFKAEGLPPLKEIEERLFADFQTLSSMQNDDGGFPFWKKGDKSWPFNTVHVVHALLRAQKKGYAVDSKSLTGALTYLENIETHFSREFSQPTQFTLSSYALYVRALAGKPDVEKARRLLKKAGPIEKLPVEALGWLLGAFSQRPEAQNERNLILRHLHNQVTETAGAAHFGIRKDDDGAHVLLRSERRADGVILETLISESPNSELIPKLVRGLLGHQKKGRWSNTQENVFILLALDSYFRTYEKVTPDFVARAWLGNRLAYEHSFVGRKTDIVEATIPFTQLAEKETLTLQKNGKGRLYYRMGLRYAPQDLKLSPAEFGFSVKRSYEAVEHPDDVQKWADGSWKIRAGARVRVRLSMVAMARRYHVALVDALPAGLEAQKAALTGLGPLRTWYEHQNLRDDRVEAFSAVVEAGVYEYVYDARATTLGTFVVPPTRAEEMYQPETFGRSASDTVRVE